MKPTPPHLPGAVPLEHPLFDLQSLTALLSGTPRLDVAVRDDAEAEQVLALAQAHGRADAIGEILEGPDQDWLYTTLPGLDLDHWLPLSRELSRQHFRFWLTLADGPARTACRHAGRLRGQLHPIGDLPAVSWLDDEGAPLHDDVRTLVPRHELVLELIEEIFATDASRHLDPDSARIIVRQRDGRVGLRMSCGLPSSTSLGPLASLIHARASHHAIRLAPDLCYVARPGWSGWHGELTLWMLLAPAPALPTGDLGIDRAPLDPGPLCASLAVQSTVDDRHAHELGALLSQVHADVRSIPRQWLRRDGQDQAVHVWTTPRAERPDLTLPAPGRGKVWWAPDRPAGNAFPDTVRAHAHRAPHRWFVRWHDALTDRDLHEVTTGRPADVTDRALVDQLIHGLETIDAQLLPSAGDAWARTVHDTDERPGITLRLDASAYREPRVYEGLLDALDIRDPRLEDLSTVAFLRDELRINLWRRCSLPDGIHRRWC